MASKERIALGSGKLYVAEHTDGTEPSVETLKKDANEMAKISGGATLEYTPTTYTAKSDLGDFSKTVLTEEEGKLNCGICTVNGDIIGKIVSTATVTEAEGKTVVKIGGIDNDNGKSYDVLFYHTDKTDGDIAVMIVGKNTKGLSMAFTKDKETITNLEFLAEPMDDSGHLAVVEFYDVQ